MYKRNSSKAVDNKTIISIIIILFAGVAVYAIGSGELNEDDFEQNEEICRTFCSEANAEFGFIDDDKDTCNCLVAQTQLDVQNNRMITWKTAIDVGRIASFDIVSPIPQDVVDAVNQQLLQQQIQAQQGQ